MKNLLDTILEFDTDSYGTVYNTSHNFALLASILEKGESVLIPWTDEEYTQLDLLFAYKSVSQGRLQRGLKKTDLFVSVIGIGAFGFSVGEDSIESHPSYIKEKFGVNSRGITWDKLTKLINSVRKQL